MTQVKERACCASGGHATRVIKEEPHNEEIVIDWRVAKSTAEAFASSMEPTFDAWEFKCSRKIVQDTEPGQTLAYSGQPGRRGKKDMKFMIPMDLLMHMLHHPNRSMVPEYKTIQRMIENISGVSPEMSKDKAVRSSSRDKAVSIAPKRPTVNPIPGFRCLYAAMRSIPLQTLIMQVQGGTISIDGKGDDDGTLATRCD
jgi:hypothetical protein